MTRKYQRIFSVISIFVFLTLSVIGCGSGSDDSKSTASVNPPPVQTTPTNTPSTTPVPTTPTTTPTPESPLVSILINDGKEISFSEDKRSDSYILGVKTGCYGNTFSVSIKITDVSVNSQGDTDDVRVSYSGSYYRKNYAEPCYVAATESFDVSGQYSFRIIHTSSSKKELIGGVPSNLMKYGDPNHDSNLYAIRAVKQAICSAVLSKADFDKTPACLGATT